MASQKCSAVIVAAGSGKRMFTEVSKQFLYINNKPILIHTLEKFQNCIQIDEIILVLSKEYLDYYTLNLESKYKFSKLKIVVGGQERHDSVFNGISNVDEKTNIILIHDGVRPFVSEKIISDVIKESSENGACIPVVQVKDTIKICEDGLVKKTIERKNLFNVQTPQGFKKEIILKAYDNFNKDELFVTDDSSIVEVLGYRVTTIVGDYNNIKITTKEDLAYAEIIYKSLN